MSFVAVKLRVFSSLSGTAGGRSAGPVSRSWLEHLKVNSLSLDPHKKCNSLVFPFIGLLLSMSFAPAGKKPRKYVITPYLDPTAQQQLQKIFFGSKTKPRSFSHMKKWAESRSLPLSRTVPGVGDVAFHRTKSGELVREVVNLEKVRVREGDDFKIKTMRRTSHRPQSAGPLTTRTTPLIIGDATATRVKAFSTARAQSTIQLLPTSPTAIKPSPTGSPTVQFDSNEEVIEERRLPKYWKRVDRIAIPNNFVKLKNCQGMSKQQIQQKYPGRSIFQATRTDRDSRTGEITVGYGEFYAETLFEEERVKKCINEHRPATAPINNISREQRVSRDRLSTPSRFLSLGDLYKDKSPSQMAKIFPGRKISRRLKELPREGSLQNLGCEDVNYGSIDSDLWEWIVERPDAKVRPVPFPRTSRTKFQPKIITKDLMDLEGEERKEYLKEKSADLSTPKTRWDEGTAKTWARDENDDLISTKIDRVDRELQDVREQMKKRLIDQGAKKYPRSAYMSKEERKMLRKRRAMHGSASEYNEQLGDNSYITMMMAKYTKQVK